MVMSNNSNRWIQCIQNTEVPSIIGSTWIISQSNSQSVVELGVENTF